MSPIHRLLASCLAAALAVGTGGCGRHWTGHQQAHGSRRSSDAIKAGPDGSYDLPLASRLFTERCASCHTMAAADAHGQVGPDLDALHEAAQTVARQVRDGGDSPDGYYMPAGLVGGPDLTDLSRYVAAVTSASAPAGAVEASTP